MLKFSELLRINFELSYPYYALVKDCAESFYDRYYIPDIFQAYTLNEAEMLNGQWF